MQDWICYQFALGNYVEVTTSSFRPNALITLCTVLKRDYLLAKESYEGRRG